MQETNLEAREKFCPVCKIKNDRDAIFCIHCGSLFDQHYSGMPATTKNTELSGAFLAEIKNPPVDKTLIPEDGIAVYVAGTSKPVYLRFEKELVFGRKSDDNEGNLLDLSELGGYETGVSRRHAMIRRGESGYELIDLASTNGSWLNEQRLSPNKPYPLASGSQLRFGRMRLLVLYNSFLKKKIQNDKPTRP